MTEQLIPFLTAAIVLTLSPGPDIIYVLVQGMSQGKQSGIVTAAGLVSGILIHTSLVAFGVSALIKESPSLFLIIRLMGAGYLLYLAYQVYRSPSEVQFSTQSQPPHKSLFSLYKKGFLMNVLNPKVAVFFLAFFPGFIWKQSDLVEQFYVLGLVFMLQAFIIFSMVAILADRVAVYLRNHPQAGRIFKGLQIIVFLGIAVFLLL